MGAEERKRLEAMGYKIYDRAGDAVGMSEEETQLLEVRLDMVFAIRRQREVMKLSQKGLATRLKISQAKFAKIESGDTTVPLDDIFLAFVAVGGRFQLLPEQCAESKPVNGTVKKRAKALAK